MATLNVGSGQTYATLSAAVAASRDGDVIAVQAGTYVNDFATIRTDITVVGVGGMANFVATVPPPNGKAIFVTQADVTIQNLSFSGAAVSDLNGAGIRHEAGNLTVIDSYFHDNQDGILAPAGGTVRITGSEFANNGAGDGYSHNIYVGTVTALIIDDSYFHDADVGHQIKSRAQSTTITNSRIYDGTGTGSYSIDIPNGGVAVIQNNVIEQGVNSANPAIIHYGGESAAYAGSSLTVSGNVVVNDMTSSSSVRMVLNATTVTAAISNNDVYGLTSGQIVSGPGTTSGTSYLSARPTLDTSAPWLDGGTDPVPPVEVGTAGPDTLIGTSGADTMSGAAGNDEYIVNHAGDVVTEGSGGGTDHVTASVDFTLPAYVEDLTLVGSARYGTGNALANVISGSGANDVLAGLGGNDTLIGGGGADLLNGGDDTDRLVGAAGNDTLLGGAGDDILVGWSGADSLVGGAGNDRYEGLDSASDIVVEGANGGTDVVTSNISYTLTANVETLWLLGTQALNGTGNDMANVIRGNDAANVLSGLGGEDYLVGGNGNDTLLGGDGNDDLVGGAGADSLIGGAGNDRYIGLDSASDIVVEGANGGTDAVTSYISYTLTANVESLTLLGTQALNGTGNNLANVIRGNDGANRLDGGGGNDVLVGGLGADTLTGGAGADIFRFLSAAEGGDRIVDFNPVADTIQISRGGFGVAFGTGPLADALLHDGTAASGSGAQFIYDSATGVLRFDADGAGGAGATVLATLSGAPALTAADIAIIA